MKTQSTKLSLFVLALTLVFAVSAGAVTLLDQAAYDFSGPGFFNVVAGAPPMGMTNYSLNDISVGAGGWVITDVSIYVNALGGFESGVTSGYLNIFPKTGPLPIDGTDDPTAGISVPMTATVISGNDYEVTVTGLSVALAPGEYWIGITPIASAFNSGIHMPAVSFMGDATASYDPYGWPMAMWMNMVPGVDAAMLILGEGDVVANETVTLDSVKSMYR